MHIEHLKLETQQLKLESEYLKQESENLKSESDEYKHELEELKSRESLALQEAQAAVLEIERLKALLSSKQSQDWFISFSSIPRIYLTNKAISCH